MIPIPENVLTAAQAEFASEFGLLVGFVVAVLLFMLGVLYFIAKLTHEVSMMRKILQIGEEEVKRMAARGER